MVNIGHLQLDPSSTRESCNNNQLCFLSKKQIGNVGDIFSLVCEGEIQYFKILDIWNTPKDFARKFLWRLCGQSEPDQLNVILEKIENDSIFAHIYTRLSWEEVRSLVKL